MPHSLIVNGRHFRGSQADEFNDRAAHHNAHDERFRDFEGHAWDVQTQMREELQMSLPTQDGRVECKKPLFSDVDGLLVLRAAQTKAFQLAAQATLAKRYSQRLCACVAHPVCPNP